MRDGEVVAKIDLPLGGLMSDKTAEEVAREHDSFMGAARAMGIEPPLDPIMGMSGLMSDKTAEEVAREHDSFMGAARAMGIEPPLDPIMGMIFLPLPVIPTLRIRPEGMFDVTRFQYA